MNEITVLRRVKKGGSVRAVRVSEHRFQSLRIMRGFPFRSIIWYIHTDTVGYVTVRIKTPYGTYKRAGMAQYGLHRIKIALIAPCSDTCTCTYIYLSR